MPHSHDPNRPRRGFAPTVLLAEDEPTAREEAARLLRGGLGQGHRPHRADRAHVGGGQRGGRALGRGQSGSAVSRQTVHVSGTLSPNGGPAGSGAIAPAEAMGSGAPLIPGVSARNAASSLPALESSPRCRKLASAKPSFSLLALSNACLIVAAGSSPVELISAPAEPLACPGRSVGASRRGRRFPDRPADGPEGCRPAAGGVPHAPDTSPRSIWPPC